VLVGSLRADIAECGLPSGSLAGFAFVCLLEAKLVAHDGFCDVEERVGVGYAGASFPNSYVEAWGLRDYCIKSDCVMIVN
jgi:hypothetical protein